MIGGTAIGLAFGAVHYARHRRDVIGVGYRIAYGLLAGYLITHCATMLAPVSPW
jgi:uncharacterized membrane protein